MTSQIYRQHSYCSYCGTPYTAEVWPRRCDHCAQMTFQNPTPVAVLIQPVEEGVLTVRRAIPPQMGKLALPGGYVDMDESWQEAAARELFEETGIEINAAGITIFEVVSVPRNVLIFAIAPPLTAAELPPFQPNSEATERVIVTTAVELAFPAHTEMLHHFLNSRPY